MHVAPFTGAWIEILYAPTFTQRQYLVAPFTGAWIEIVTCYYYYLNNIASHPSRVRGLKFPASSMSNIKMTVAPFTGAWIEIPICRPIKGRREVAPFTGAWIEIRRYRYRCRPGCMSHPSRVRGLKSGNIFNFFQ